MMKGEDLIYVLALQHVPRIGDITAKKLIHHCGSPAAVFESSARTLCTIDGVGTATIKGLLDAKHMQEAEKELQYIKDNEITSLYFKANDYPEKLKHCIDSPLVLFQVGNINLKEKRIISVIGTRKITRYGVAFCEKLIEELAPFDPVIVSGFAYGTDITAQKAALSHRLQTVGCLAHGFDQIYPKSHKKYMKQVESHGGFLTEFWTSDPFERTNFLKRNRVIAGMSEATIVIESAEKGGSLVTADIANSYGKDVFALPGRVTDRQSMGCNTLIKTHQAHVLSNPLDIPYILNWELETSKKPSLQKQLFVAFNSQEQCIYKYLNANGKQGLDDISRHCEMPTFTVVGLLLQLELKGVVNPLPGKLFELV